MAAGLPCITTELGTGTSYVVQHGITGLVVPPKDPDALASAVRRLLDDDGLRQRMGQCGRQRVQQEFSTERMIEEVERVYHLALTPADDV